MDQIDPIDPIGRKTERERKKERKKERKRKRGQTYPDTMAQLQAIVDVGQSSMQMSCHQQTRNVISDANRVIYGFSRSTAIHVENFGFFFVASFIKSQKDHLCGFMQISGSPTLDWSLEDSDWPSPADQKIITIEY